MIRQWWQRLQQRCATCSRVTLGLGALGYILADTFLKGRWRKARLAAEADLP